MEDKQQEIKDFFSQNFKAVEYMNDEFWKDVPELFRFMTMFIHDAFHSGKVNFYLIHLYTNLKTQIFKS